ncbi:MAG TPA: hypothetical protein DEQ61_20040 [Streptomyces sp.]|nr:hypothetical protein [Streptomyces sp.]
MGSVHGTTSTRETTDWRDQALCREVDPEIMFPESSQTAIDEAKQLCARCPVIDACSEWAITTGEQFGIWGGMDQGQRAKARRERGFTAARTPAACGTESGAKRHRRNGEDPCGSCKEAQLAVWAQRRVRPSRARVAA